MESIQYVPEAANDTMIAFIGTPDEWLMTGIILSAVAVLAWRILNRVKTK